MHRHSDHSPPVHWHEGPLGALQALPTDGKPITGPDWHDQDSAFYSVVAGIRQVLQEVAPRIAIKNLALFQTLAGNQVAVRSVALSGDGRTLVSGAEDGTIKLWEVVSGSELRTLAGHKGGVWSVALSGDGRTLVSGGRDGMIKLWELPGGRELRCLEGHQGAVLSVALGVDGKTLVSGGEYGSIMIWRA